MPPLQLVVLPVNRMRDRMRDIILLDEIGHVINILRPLLKLAMGLISSMPYTSTCILH